MDDLDTINEQANALAASIAVVRERLKPVLRSANPGDRAAEKDRPPTTVMEICADLDQVDPLDSARLCVSLAYTINALFFTYLRTEGRIKGHPVRKELARIKTYMDKVATAAGLNKPTMRIDQAAAKRFIKHSLSHDAPANPAPADGEAAEHASAFLNHLESPAPTPTPPATAAKRSSAAVESSGSGGGGGAASPAPAAKRAKVQKPPQAKKVDASTTNEEEEEEEEEETATTPAAVATKKRVQAATSAKAAAVTPAKAPAKVATAPVKATVAKAKTPAKKAK
ncbi:hypothetical protein DFJ73DRAFT_816434 [Zopfochytrium polystomum]|nr:hypothetical protein DFJ73DRAFT_816434 [Zopfochytrium polystomum]